MHRACKEVEIDTFEDDLLNSELANIDTKLDNIFQKNFQKSIENKNSFDVNHANPCTFCGNAILKHALVDAFANTIHFLQR